MLALAAAICLVLAQTGAVAHGAREPVSAARLAASDPRLSRRISLSLTRACIGELLERVSSQSGVVCAADAGDGASDPEVAVFARDVTVAGLMESLWALLSHRNAEWAWRSSGSGAERRYVLHQPLAARRFAQRIRGDVQALFEEQADALIEAGSLPAEARPAHLEQTLRGRFRHDATVPRRLASSERILAGMRMFGELFTADERRQVLRGKPRGVAVPVARLSEESRLFVRQQWDRAKAYRIEPATGQKILVPEPGSVTFYVRNPGSGNAPCLFIDLEGLGAYGYAGGRPLEREARHRLMDAWMLPGDRPITAIKDSQLTRPSTPLATVGHDVITRLAEVSAGAGVAVVARLPPPTAGSRLRRDPGDPTGQSLRACLETLANRPFEYLIKTRRGVVLVADAGWFQAAEGLVPWTVRKRLRGELARSGGIPSLPFLAEVAGTLTDEQLQTLGAETAILSRMAELRDLFRLARSRPLVLSQLRSSRGVPVPDLRPALQPGSAAARELGIDAAEAAFLRVERRTSPLGPELAFIVSRADGSALRTTRWLAPRSVPLPGPGPGGS